MASRWVAIPGYLRILNHNAAIHAQKCIVEHLPSSRLIRQAAGTEIFVEYDAVEIFNGAHTCASVLCYF